LTFCQKIFTQSSNLFFLAIGFLSHFHSETLYICAKHKKYQIERIYKPYALAADHLWCCQTILHSVDCFRRKISCYLHYSYEKITLKKV